MREWPVQTEMEHWTREAVFLQRGRFGDFATTNRSITVAIDEAICRLNGSAKETGQKYIAYFQSFSNTYAPIDILRPMYLEALAHPDIVGLSIATRPDCFSRRFFPARWMQADETDMDRARSANGARAYGSFHSPWISSACFWADCAHAAYTQYSGDRPRDPWTSGETEADILETIQYLNTQHIQGIKLQLLHVLKGTDLAVYLEEHPWHILTQEEYVDLVIRCIGNLSPRLWSTAWPEMVQKISWSHHTGAATNGLFLTK